MYLLVPGIEGIFFFVPVLEERVRLGWASLVAEVSGVDALLQTI